MNICVITSSFLRMQNKIKLTVEREGSKVGEWRKIEIETLQTIYSFWTNALSIWKPIFEADSSEQLFIFSIIWAVTTIFSALDSRHHVVGKAQIPQRENALLQAKVLCQQ